MKLRSLIDSVLEKILISIMSLMVINVLWQVFSRYILSDPSSFTDELARYLMIWLGVLGAAYVAGKGNHVAITYFSEKLNVENQKKVKVLIHLFILSFAVFLYLPIFFALTRVVKSKFIIALICSFILIGNISILFFPHEFQYPLNLYSK